MGPPLPPSPGAFLLSSKFVVPPDERSEGGRAGPDGSLLSLKGFQRVTWGLCSGCVRPLPGKGS